jgi:hypothetical protein
MKPGDSRISITRRELMQGNPEFMLYEQHHLLKIGYL